MRQFKFRVWDKEQQMMHNCGEDVHDAISFDEDGTAFYYNLQNGCGSGGEDSEYVLMQYTGLKDRNNKEIYEGDILDGSWVNPMSKEKIVRFYKVVYEKAVFYAQLIGHHPYGTTLLYFENKNSQVAGNIFNNPELLEVPHG